MPEELGQQPVVLSGDSRLVELGITERLQQECNAVVWDPARGSENITQAEQAKVGVVYADYGLTESGGVVLFSAPERGRSLSLLPESSIFVLRKSSILPRVAQLAVKLPQKAQAGERLQSIFTAEPGLAGLRTNAGLRADVRPWRERFAGNHERALALVQLAALVLLAVVSARSGWPRRGRSRARSGRGSPTC